MKAYKYLFLAPIVAIFSVASAADISAMMDDCNGCHGDNGVSQWGDVPTIAGIDAFGIADALFMYRDEERPCSESEYRQGDTSRAATTMCALTADLSDDDIELLGDAYAELAFVPAVQLMQYWPRPGQQFTTSNATSVIRMAAPTLRTKLRFSQVNG